VEEVIAVPMTIELDELQELIQRGATLVEVLPAEMYQRQHLPGAISIPLKELNRSTTARLRNGRPIVVYCHDYE